MIIAVGYRVNSAKATQFRIWATKILRNNVNFPKNAWQDLVYFVDIEVEKIQGKIQCYKVLKVYFEDTQIKE